MADIFIHVNDAQHGPYTAEQLRAWLRDGTVTPNTIAWREGMPSWQPLSAWGGMVPANVPRPQAHAPYQPAMAQAYPQQAYYTPMQEPGYGRLKYFGFGMLFNILIIGVFGGAVALYLYINKDEPRNNDVETTVFIGGYVLCILLVLATSIWLGVKRLQNIGWSGLLILLMFVPLISALLSFCLIALPPGYARTKKLDGPAWFWIILLIVLIVLMVVAVAIGVISDASRH